MPASWPLGQSNTHTELLYSSRAASWRTGGGEDSGHWQ